MHLQFYLLFFLLQHPKNVLYWRRLHTLLYFPSFSLNTFFLLGIKPDRHYLKRIVSMFSSVYNKRINPRINILENNTEDLSKTATKEGQGKKHRSAINQLFIAQCRIITKAAQGYIYFYSPTKHFVFFFVLAPPVIGHWTGKPIGPQRRTAEKQIIDAVLARLV